MNLTRIEYDDRGRMVDLFVRDLGDIWQVMCMDCGVGVGSVPAGHTRRAKDKLDWHNDVLHGGRFDTR